jgi:CRISPR-associated endonuclease/helicase Cas3
MSLLYNIRQYGKNSKSIKSAICEREYGILNLIKFKIAPANPYGFQLQAAKAKGNLILRAPTGSGKTEAALLWAQQNQQYNGRLFYALPTTASINAMYLRLQKLFGDRKSDLMDLLHSHTISSLYSLFEKENSNNSLANQAKARDIGSLVREMYYPIRVCTPHQVLRYTLQGKGWEYPKDYFGIAKVEFDHCSLQPRTNGSTGLQRTKERGKRYGPTT